MMIYKNQRFDMVIKGSKIKVEISNPFPLSQSTYLYPLNKDSYNQIGSIFLDKRPLIVLELSVTETVIELEVLSTLIILKINPDELIERGGKVIIILPFEAST